MSRILVLGGSGAMGVYLVDMLNAAGHHVFATSRHKIANKDNIEFLTGDAHENDFLDRVLNRIRPDAVVDFMSYTTAEFLRRYDMLLKRTGHYVFLSSYRVFADDTVLDECSSRLLDVCQDGDYLKTDEYALAKARQENTLREAKSGNWSIVRPSITYSKGRFQFGCLEANVVCYRALHGCSVVMPHEMLNRQTTMTWGRDAALLISKLILNSRAMSEDFNVVTAEHHSWREVFEIYEKVIGMRLIEVPMRDYLRICNPYQVRYDRMFDRVMDNSKVLKATGVLQSDLTPLSIGLTMELKDFQSHVRYARMDPRRNALIDGMVGECVGMTGQSRSVRLRYMISKSRALDVLSQRAIEAKEWGMGVLSGYPALYKAVKTTKNFMFRCGQ